MNNFAKKLIVRALRCRNAAMHCALQFSTLNFVLMRCNLSSAILPHFAGQFYILCKSEADTSEAKRYLELSAVLNSCARATFPAEISRSHYN